MPAMMDAAGHITLQRDDTSGIVTLTLRRADNERNQINVELMQELETALERRLPELKPAALIVASGYEKLFSTGADVEAIGDSSVSEAAQYSATGHQVFGLLRRLPCPTIAALHGFVLGGALELALHCDFRVCSAGARLALPEINLGIIPGWGGTQLLQRLIGPHRALRMILSGEPVNAETALSWGLVDEVAPGNAELPAVAHKLAARFAGKSRRALTLAKRAVYDGAQLGLTDALALEARIFAEAWGNDDRREGIAALIEKRRPSWPE